MKLKSTKSNYMPTKYDFHAMSACLKVGCKIFPYFLPQQVWVRYDPLITLVATVNGRRYNLIEKPFEQPYLGYYTFIFYRKFYEKNIIKKIEVKAPEIVRPAFPPPPPMKQKELMPPPPPKK